MIPFRFPGGLARLGFFLTVPTRPFRLAGHLIPSVDDFRQNPCYTTEAFRLRSLLAGASVSTVWLASSSRELSFLLRIKHFPGTCHTGASGDFAEDVKATPLGMWCGSVGDTGIASPVVIGVRQRLAPARNAFATLGLRVPEDRREARTQRATARS